MKRQYFKSFLSNLGYVHFFLLVLLTFVLVVSTRADELKESSADFEKKWGIRILSLRSTAADYMIDFRYRVVDAEKARPLFRRKSRPQLIEQQSGATMNVFSSPKTGPMRTTNMPQENRNYAILFANPGRYIKVGSKVTVLIDDFRAEDLIVQ